MRVDYHMHLEEDDFYGLCPYDVDRIRQYVAAAQDLGVDEIGITEHAHRFPAFLDVMVHLFQPKPLPGTWWLADHFNQPLDLYVSAVREAQALGLPVKLSIEVDYLPGAERQLRAILSRYDWDYVVGSVHFLDWAIDVGPEYGWPEADVDAAYVEYFRRLQAAAGSGLFDVLAHPDLIKKFGHRPSFDLAPLYDEVVEALVEADVAIELSTAGWRKPVGEPYPAPDLLRRCAAAGVPLTLGSDAHSPKDVGADFDRAVALAWACGYREIAVFRQRERSMRALS